MEFVARFGLPFSQCLLGRNLFFENKIRIVFGKGKHFSGIASLFGGEDQSQDPVQRTFSRRSRLSARLT